MTRRVYFFRVEKECHPEALPKDLCKCLGFFAEFTLSVNECVQNDNVASVKNLIIVESPTKARTIGRFLGDDYRIEASMGHLIDLPKSTLGVDVDKHFAPQFEQVLAKKDIIDKLKREAKEADTIILATDPDREGEAIASHIAELLGNLDTRSLGKKINLRTQKPTPPKTYRIVFHEITKEAIEEALKNPRDIDNHLVDAQTARRVLDRLVGYKLSPLLWKKVRRGLSAGRVQSVALRLIVEREREIEKFKKDDYWAIIANLGIGKEDGVEFELVEINNKKIEMQRAFDLYDGQYRVTKTVIAKEEEARKIEEDLKTRKFIVSDVTQKETRRSPHAPFTTSTMQQDAARQLGFSAKRTMSVAQKLYEEGFITYHRTDSVVMGNNALFSIRDYVKKEFGEKYLPEKPRFYKTKQKLAQEAHEAVRPTSVGQGFRIKDEVIKAARNDGWRLYELVWKRAVASQMADAVIESTAVTVDADRYRLKANGSVLVFEGFLKVNPQALMDKKIPQYTVSESLNLININAEKHETPPPPRYNDASLIQTLEEKGIGRPSTYAPIISTIESRQYVEKNEGRFSPTPVGIAVNDFLVTNFPDIDDIPFTAEMEDHLDSIAKGEKEWTPMIETFYEPFAKKLEKVEDAARVKIEVEKTDEKCEKCGAPLVVRIGRFGKFLSCSTFPKCDFTRSFSEETNLTCPKDEGKVVIKKTKRGRRFYGCSNYPKCDFAAWKLDEIVKKPKLPS